MDVVEQFGPNVGLGGLLAALVLLVVRSLVVGTLVPRSTLEDVRTDRDARIVEEKSRADEWKEVAVTAQATIAAQAKQLDELVSLARTSAHVLQSLPRPAAEQRAVDRAEADG